MYLFNESIGSGNAELRGNYAETNVTMDRNPEPAYEIDSRADVELGGDMEISMDEAMPDVAPVSSNEIRGVSINPLSSGYMVKVGCQSVAVETTEKLIDMLNKYLSDPTEFERKWYSKNVRNRLDNI